MYKKIIVCLKVTYKLCHQELNAPGLALDRNTDQSKLTWTPWYESNVLTVVPKPLACLPERKKLGQLCICKNINKLFCGTYKIYCYLRIFTPKRLQWIDCFMWTMNGFLVIWVWIVEDRIPVWESFHSARFHLKMPHWIPE